MSDMCCAKPGQSWPTSMLNGMKPSARWVGTAGWAIVGELSVDGAASASYFHETPADERPFHWSLVIVSIRHRFSTGLSDPCAVRMMVGSMITGTAKPPAAGVPIDIDRLR